MTVVNSYTEWDPLEEVVVGTVRGGVFPAWQRSMRAMLSKESCGALSERAGRPFPDTAVQAAEREIDGLVSALALAGVTVVRPDPVDHGRPFSTPHWTSTGFYSAMPRDLLLVIGDTIIEAPLSWRCRYHEVDAYRALVKSYFRHGARWLPAPRPQLTSELFTGDWPAPDGAYAITEFEPVFDAADFLRFGQDIIAQRSQVTNAFGISWLQRALGSRFRVHQIKVNDPCAMHIDATLIPLAPGKLLVNPDRFIPHDLFCDWEIRQAPRPTLPPDWPMYFCSPWVSMNVLSLDAKTVIVERQEEPLIEALRAWGFHCIPLDFRHVYTFGGSFHCVTLDVRRAGGNGRYLTGAAVAG